MYLKVMIWANFLTLYIWSATKFFHIGPSDIVIARNRLLIPANMKRHFLESKRWLFGSRKMSFYLAKGYLLKGICNYLIINSVSSIDGLSFFGLSFTVSPPYMLYAEGLKVTRL